MIDIFAAESASEELQPDYPDGLALFRSALTSEPNRPFLHYFDATLSYADVDEASNALAAGLLDAGFRHGDRVALYMQNIPQFLVALVATWKCGGTVVTINPMNRSRELGLILNDAEPRVLIAEAELIEVAYDKLDDDDYRPALVFTTNGWAYQDKPEPRFFSGDPPSPPAGTCDLLAFIAENAGRVPESPPLDPDDVAMLVYTSGTSGTPKGVINLHRGVAWGSQLSRNSQDLPDGVITLGIAPLFHIAGLIMCTGSTLHARGTLVLCYRFEPMIVIEAIARHRPHTTSGSITVYIALMNAAGATPEILSSIVKPFSGGAPVPIAVIDQYLSYAGTMIRTGYGLTETTGGACMEPTDGSRKVDAATGTLSVGRPVATFAAHVVDDAGRKLPPGEAGEVVLKGPAVSPGYWRNPQATAEAMQPDGFHTGDIGFLDEEGWLFLIDRKKDMIIAGGYKVWPREVEDVLYAHPSVREAAVVGVKDSYRGETVKAIVSLKPGTTATPEALISFCRERMAAYKYPRILDIVDELPKSPAGKILKRQLQVHEGA
jgi:long-chain acyl-CoA synthetase